MEFEAGEGGGEIVGCAVEERVVVVTDWGWSGGCGAESCSVGWDCLGTWFRVVGLERGERERVYACAEVFDRCHEPDFVLG